MIFSKFWSDKGLKDTVVNRTCLSINERSIEITLTGLLTKYVQICRRKSIRRNSSSDPTGGAGS